MTVVSRPEVLSVLLICVSLVALLSACGASSMAGEDQLTVRPRGRLAIYYGWPSRVNGAGGNVDQAVAAFAAHDLIVFGDGLQYPSHPDHIRARQIIARLVAGGAEVYGYVDMGVTTQNLPLTTAQQYVDAWRAMGVQGIFWDDAGADFGVTAARRNALLAYTHERGLRVFINAWNPDDALAGTTSGSAQLTAADLYLAESWLIGDGRYMDLRAWAAKSDRLMSLRQRTGVRIAAVATGDTSGDSRDPAHPFQMAWWGAAMYNLDFFGYTTPGYSAHSVGADRLWAPEEPKSEYGSVFESAVVEHHDWNTRHDRKTDLGTITVTGDGRSWGQGAFQADASPATATPGLGSPRPGLQIRVYVATMTSTPEGVATLTSTPCPGPSPTPD